MRTAKPRLKINRVLLKSKIVLKGMKISDISKAIDIPQASFSHKMNSGSFSTKEMVVIQNLLELSVKDFNYIFFEGGLSFIDTP